MSASDATALTLPRAPFLVLTTRIQLMMVFKCTLVLARKYAHHFGNKNLHPHHSFFLMLVVVLLSFLQSHCTSLHVAGAVSEVAVPNVSQPMLVRLFRCTPKTVQTRPCH